MQVLYLGRAPRTKETLPDFLKWCRVTRHPLVFRGLTDSQRTPGFGASQKIPSLAQFIPGIYKKNYYKILGYFWGVIITTYAPLFCNVYMF